MRATKHIGLLFGCLAIVLFAGACEEDVASPSGVEEPYSMYGILNPRLTTQTIMVSPIEPLLFDFPDSIDAKVASIDLASGEKHVWQDSVTVNETGRLDHVFRSSFRPAFGSRHRVEVTRSDGATSSVEVDIPVEVTVEQEDTGTRKLIVYVRGDAFRLIRVDVVYYVRHYANTCDTPEGSYAFSYTGREKKRPDGWRVEIDLGIHYDLLESYYHIDFPEVNHYKCIGACENPAALALMNVKLSITVGNEAWNPPGGEFDPNVLAQPGTMNNVENGYGFVSGGYNQDRSLYPSSQALEDTWFEDFMLRPPSDCQNYCLCGQQ
jgi:hypothetical protein